MRYAVRIAQKPSIPLFAEKPSHPFVPLGRRPAGARSEGQGRRFAGALRAPLTAASTLAGWRRIGDQMVSRYALLLFASVLPIAMLGGVATAQPVTAERAATSNPYADYIAEASQRFGVPIAWIMAVMRAESAGDVQEVSRKGAMGLMQLMPDTWAELRVRHGFGRNVCDPRDNILAGTAYLREMFDRYGNVGAMLAAYNAGPGRYDEYLSIGRPLPAETRDYVAAIFPLIEAGDRAEPIVVAAVTPDAWRRAPLFVERSMDVRSTESMHADQRPADSSASSLARDVSAIEPRSDGLFVARSSAEAPQ